jgi:tetratricopeptide (TPR) repeat protein
MDGEVSDDATRRILVHLEICPGCKAFMQSLRLQMGFHRSSQVQGGKGTVKKGEKKDSTYDFFDPFAQSFEDEEDPFAGDLFAGEELWEGMEEWDSPSADSFLGKMVDESRERLADVFYQLGRAYLCLTTNQHFWILTYKEPVPIPEFQDRGKAILEGVSGGELIPSHVKNKGEREGWLEARHLLEGKLDEEDDLLEKAHQYLLEALSLKAPFPKALIWLGDLWFKREDYAKARTSYEEVLRVCPEGQGPKDQATGVPLRVFAIEKLAVLSHHLGRIEEAISYTEEEIRLGAVEMHPNFSSALWNLGAMRVEMGEISQALEPFSKLYQGFPEQRDRWFLVFSSRPPHFFEAIEEEGDALRFLEDECSDWFGVEARQKMKEARPNAGKTLFSVREEREKRQKGSHGGPVTERPSQ